MTLDYFKHEPRSLWDVCENHHGGNPRSVEARQSTNVKRDRDRILEWVAKRGTYGAICYEVEVALGMRHQTASPRFSDLKDDGSIVANGEQRPTDSKCMANVYVAVEK